MKKLDIIIPVYDGYQDTVACIRSVIGTMDTAQSRLILVDDQSPNPSIREYLLEMASVHDFVQLIINEENLGFVASVNKAMSAGGDNDVILVNSDVVVANDWFIRLFNAAYSSADIGTVTATSNNATICSFPGFCEDNELVFGLDVASIDKALADFAADPVEIPTGVGNCMYIKRECLDNVGLFDEETFGAGYGEENDFCRRALASGWKNFQATDVFVYHVGGVSFGQQKQARIDRAVNEVERKNPGYLSAVSEFIEKDPWKAQRIGSLLNLVAVTELPKLLFISHHLGGGVARHVTELADYYQGEAIVFHLQPAENECCELSIISNGKVIQDSLLFRLSIDRELLVQLLKIIGINHIHIHHMMGWSDTIAYLIKALDCQYDVTLHDYFYINGSPTQVNSKGVYTENPDEVEGAVSENLDYWQRDMRDLLSKARYTIAPSNMTREIYLKHYPGLHILVSSHVDIEGLGFKVRAPDYKTDSLRVGVIGAISKEKGADVIDGVARELKLRGAAVDIILIGYAYRPLENVTYSTGPYKEENLLDLVEKNLIDVLWYPALWPETYCYTLSYGLLTGLPIVASNIGSFPERLKGRSLSYILNESDDVAYADFFCKLPQTIKQDLSVNFNESFLVRQDDFYASKYLLGLSVTANTGEKATIEKIVSTVQLIKRQQINWRVKVLKILVRIRSSRYFARLARIIPIQWQKKVKRLLSSQPIHDL